MVRSIMLFAGWVTLLFTFGFFTFARSGEDSRSSPNEEGEIVFKSLEKQENMFSINRRGVQRSRSRRRKRRLCGWYIRIGPRRRIAQPWYNPWNEEGSDTEMFHLIPDALCDGTCDNIFSALVSLCYGKHNAVDLIELCGGAGRISTLAFKRNLESGGNLDLTTQSVWPWRPCYARGYQSWSPCMLRDGSCTATQLQDCGTTVILQRKGEL